MIVNMYFTIDDEVVDHLRKALLATGHREFAFIDAVHQFMETDEFYDAVCDSLEVAVGLRKQPEPEGFLIVDGQECVG
jgi:hypothetical protein